MRLGQLARKLSIRQTDIVDFLAKSSSIEIANESNARLEDDHVHIIIQHFAPSLLNQKEDETEPVYVEEPQTQPAVVEDNEVGKVSVVEQIIFSEEVAPSEEKIEVIKAPKVDLPGLKVLGKIDLPEPKKKETLSVDEDKSEGLPPKPEEKERTRVPKTRNTLDNRKSVNRSSVNPIALKREREARAAEEKRKEDAIKEKEKRTEYYLNRVKINAPTKAVRMYAEPVEEFTATSKREEPKTLLGRFFRWLTTA